MIIRKLVVLIGVITVLVGAVQIALPRKVEGLIHTALTSSWIYAFAALVLLAGIILVTAAGLKQVRISRLILLIGLLSLLAGIFLFAAPAFAKDIVDAFLFKRADSYRVMAIAGSGLLRIIFGALIVYSASRPPAPRTPRLGSIVPLA
jgi:hypothetical protein